MVEKERNCKRENEGKGVKVIKEEGVKVKKGGKVIKEEGVKGEAEK